MTARGLNQAKLASRAGVSEKSIERLFAGLTISPSIVKAIAGAIGSTPDAIYIKPDAPKVETPRTFTISLHAICTVPSDSLTPELSDIGRQVVSQLQARGIVVTAQAHTFVATDPADNWERRIVDLVIKPGFTGPLVGFVPFLGLTLPGLLLGALQDGLVARTALRPSRYYELLDRLAEGPMPIDSAQAFGEPIHPQDCLARDVLLRTNSWSNMPPTWTIKSIRPRSRHGMPLYTDPDHLDSLLRRPAF